MRNGAGEIPGQLGLAVHPGMLAHMTSDAATYAVRASLLRAEAISAGETFIEQTQA